MGRIVSNSTSPPLLSVFHPQMGPWKHAKVPSIQVCFRETLEQRPQGPNIIFFNLLQGMLVTRTVAVNGLGQELASVSVPKINSDDLLQQMMQHLQSRCGDNTCLLLHISLPSTWDLEAVDSKMSRRRVSIMWIKWDQNMLPWGASLITTMAHFHSPNSPVPWRSTCSVGLYLNCTSRLRIKIA